MFQFGISRASIRRILRPYLYRNGLEPKTEFISIVSYGGNRLLWASAETKIQGYASRVNGFDVEVQFIGQLGGRLVSPAECPRVH